MTTCHIRLREWRSIGPDDAAGAGLRGLRLDGDQSRSLAKRLRAAGILEVLELHDGVHVRAYAHVGRVAVGDLTVTVEPKIGTTELLELLRYAYGLRQLRLFDQTAFSTTGTLLQDLIASQLLTEATELAARGLLKKYVARTERLGSPRGRIDINDLARRGPQSEASITCRHHQRSIDHVINRVLVAGLRWAADIAVEPTLRRSLLRLADRIGNGVGLVVLSMRMLEDARRSLDRMAASYEPALRLIELVVACSAISLDEERTASLPGFLFDMNRFFQALVGRFLTEHLEGFDVQAEYGLTGMMRYVPESNPRGVRAPQPRPDFAVRIRGDEVVALLDAKYRDLWETNLPREMLYQLAMYALSQKRGGSAVILYPTTATTACDAVVEIRGPLGENALAFVTLRPVIVSELLSALRDESPAPRTALARQFALQPNASTPAELRIAAI